MAPDVNEALAALWLKFKRTNLERVDRLEAAATALANGNLDDAGRRAAERDAHRLAGAAGTFGFAEGSRLAGAAELLLQATTPLPTEQAARLQRIATDLRRELDRAPSPPAAEPDRAPSPPAAELALSASGEPCVLIVSRDAELARRLLDETTSQHYLARHAESVAAARAATREQPPDAVLIDLDASGERSAALELIDALGAPRPGVPVLVLSARSGLLDRVEAVRHGAAIYLPKPVSAAQVGEALGQVLKRERTVEERILAVDDDPLVLETLETLLVPFGYRVMTLLDPLRFWEVLDESPPDLVLLDLDMPTLSGIELCRVVRTDLRWAGLPVLFLTAHTNPDTVQRIFAAGADDYIAKPVVGPELLTRVANRLERARLHRRLAETDVLTGLANRQKASQALGQLLRLSDRHTKPVSLAVIDLDHFKSINDRFGHTTGDSVLRRIGDLLGHAFRRDDVVGRWGGEEFVVGLFGMPGAAAEQRLGRALAGLREQAFSAPNGERFGVSFSAGIAEYPRDGNDLGALFQAADAALYRAKAAGRGRIVPAG